MIAIGLIIRLDSGARNSIAARLARHLYGRAKHLGAATGGLIPRPDVVASTDAGNPYPMKPALSLEDGDSCEVCEGLLLADRVRVEWRHGIGVVIPCYACRWDEYLAFKTRQRRLEQLEREEETSASGGGPPAVVAQSRHTGPVASDDAAGPVAGGIDSGGARKSLGKERSAAPRASEVGSWPPPPAAEADPWDLSQEEQVDGAIRLTSRELCDAEDGRGSGCPSSRRDRSSYDEHDDMSDIQPFERTTAYPWGRR